MRACVCDEMGVSLCLCKRSRLLRDGVIYIIYDDDDDDDDYIRTEHCQQADYTNKKLRSDPLLIGYVTELYYLCINTKPHTASKILIRTIKEH